MNPLLEERVVSSLRTVIGLPLTSVVYHCLSGEAQQDDIFHPTFYLGGEIELVFGERQSVFVTWEENAGWEPFHFSLLISPKTAFSGGYLVPLSASGVSFWKPHLGELLSGAIVSGCNGVPLMARLRFRSGDVLVGISFKTSFGEGDDVFVALSESHPRMQDGMATLWECTMRGRRLIERD